MKSHTHFLSLSLNYTAWLSSTSLYLSGFLLVLFLCFLGLCSKLGHLRTDNTVFLRVEGLAFLILTFFAHLLVFAQTIPLSKPSRKVQV